MSKRNPDRDPQDRYFTAPKLAARIAAWAGLRPGMTVLEPSAGDGKLVQAIRAYGCNVVAVELLEEECAKLRQLPEPELVEGLPGKPGTLVVVQGDFLTWYPALKFGKKTSPHAFDRVVMNPPFSDGADGRHVGHASRFGANVVALVRTNFEHTQGRWLSCLQYVRITRKAFLVGRPPPFGGPGDRNQTPQSDYVVLDLERRPAARQPGEADLVAVEYWT